MPAPIRSCCAIRAGLVAALALVAPLVLGPARAPAADEAPRAPARIGPAQTDADGFLVHAVESDLQSGPTEVRVLLPARRPEGTRFPCVYVLPVEAGNGRRWGDGLAEVKKSGLADRLGLVCVYPTFAQLPWYADHPTNPRLAQETYFRTVVVPFVERTYPVRAERDGRLLLGFSKSGWGALTLLLRHPDDFGRAVAWDSPLMKDAPNQFGMGDIFGTQENFVAYQPTRLVREKREALGPAARFAVLGYDGFRAQHVQFHALLEELRIPHDYRDGPQQKHHWESGWVGPAVEWLAKGPGEKR